MKQKTAAEIRKKITGEMVKAIKAGTPPWREPWETGLPTSCRGHRYRGINLLILMFSGFYNKFWGTKDAWEKMAGVRPKRGQKPYHVVFFNYVAKKGDDKDKIPIIREFPVFNAEQMIADTPKAKKRLARFFKEDEARNNEPDYKPFEEFVQNLGAKIRHGYETPFYRPDFIGMPMKRRFDSMADYYQTLSHELIHWVVNGFRLRPNLKERTYAFNELVAEMGSCFLLTEMRLPLADKMIQKSRSYLASWLKIMGEDPKFLFQAASEASNAVDYLLEHGSKKCRPNEPRSGTGTAKRVVV